MAIDIRSLPGFFSDDATFRTWGSGINAQLSAVGLIQTANTDQINWTTVLWPAVNVVAGYEIWRFNDDLQVTNPVFIKVEYGGNSTRDRPNLFITVGTSTDGAGTINGQVGARNSCTTTLSSSVGQTWPSYCSGSSSRLSLFTNTNQGSINYSIGIFIERPKNAEGIEQSDFIITQCFRTTFQLIPYIGNVITGGFSPTINPKMSNLSILGANVALCPVLAFYGKMMFCSWLMYAHVDIAELTTFNADHLGAAHTFFSIGDAHISTNIGLVNDVGATYAMLWE